MLEVKQVTKCFKKLNEKHQKEEFLAVNDVSLEAKMGEIVGILGPNGAGKTTLLRMIAGIMSPTTGQIMFDDLTYLDHELEIKKRIAYLSGNTKIYPSLSTYELLHMCASFYQVSPKEIKKRIMDISHVLQLEPFLYERIENLSTGQTQRANIARCLIHDPDYYIFDEATNGLDIISSQIILDFMKEERKKGKCILYSTHYMEEAENICDRVIMIHHGKIIRSGTPKQMKEETKTTNLRDAFFRLIGETEHEK